VPLDCTEQRLDCTNSNAIINIKRTPPSIIPAANHHQIVIASAMAQQEPNPVNASDVGTLVLFIDAGHGKQMQAIQLCLLPYKKEKNKSYIFITRRHNDNNNNNNNDGYNDTNGDDNDNDNDNGNDGNGYGNG
jgi:hypothetical protein